MNRVNLTNIDIRLKKAFTLVKMLAHFASDLASRVIDSKERRLAPIGKDIKYS